MWLAGRIARAGLWKDFKVLPEDQVEISVSHTLNSIIPMLLPTYAIFAPYLGVLISEMGNTSLSFCLRSTRVLDITDRRISDKETASHASNQRSAQSSADKAESTRDDSVQCLEIFLIITT